MNILFFIFCLVTNHIHNVGAIEDRLKEDVKLSINSPVKTIHVLLNI